MEGGCPLYPHRAEGISTWHLLGLAGQGPPSSGWNRDPHLLAAVCPCESLGGWHVELFWVPNLGSASPSGLWPSLPGRDEGKMAPSLPEEGSGEQWPSLPGGSGWGWGAVSLALPPGRGASVEDRALEHWAGDSSPRFAGHGRTQPGTAWSFQMVANPFPRSGPQTPNAQLFTADGAAWAQVWGGGSVQPLLALARPSCGWGPFPPHQTWGLGLWAGMCAQPVPGQSLLVSPSRAPHHLSPPHCWHHRITAAPPSP